MTLKTFIEHPTYSKVMKKNPFLWWLIALMFSCSYEIEAPSALEENISVKFSVEEARKHFEENATDLTFIRLSKHDTETENYTRFFTKLL